MINDHEEECIDQPKGQASVCPLEIQNCSDLP